MSSTHIDRVIIADEVIPLPCQEKPDLADDVNPFSADKLLQKTVVRTDVLVIFLQYNSSIFCCKTMYPLPKNLSILFKCVCI